MTNSLSTSIVDGGSTTSQTCIKLQCHQTNELLPKFEARCLVMSSDKQLQLDVQPCTFTNDGYKRITNPQCVDNCAQNARGAQSSNSAAKGFISQDHDIPHMCGFSQSHQTDTFCADKSARDVFSVQTPDADNLSPLASTSGCCFNGAGQIWDDPTSPGLFSSFESVFFKVPDVPSPGSNEKATNNEIARLVDSSPLYSPFTSEQDYSSLKSVLHRLYISGFYYEGLSSKDATELLVGKPNGSFLLRDSSDPNHLFSLSLKTPRGTTSVRIEYHKGKFRLDSEDCLKSRMPTFDCVISLIMYYVKRIQGKSGRRVLLDSTGRRDLPVKLTRPVLKSVPMLKHCSRKAICRTLKNPSMDIQRLPFPNLLKSYLSQYPYPL